MDNDLMGFHVLLLGFPPPLIDEFHTPVLAP